MFIYNWGSVFGCLFDIKSILSHCVSWLRIVVQENLNASQTMHTMHQCIVYTN